MTQWARLECGHELEIETTKRKVCLQGCGRQTVIQVADQAGVWHDLQRGQSAKRQALAIDDCAETACGLAVHSSWRVAVNGDIKRCEFCRNDAEPGAAIGVWCKKHRHRVWLHGTQTT